MKGIGVFGGTFDPIHLGHLIIAEQTRDALSLEKIIFVPNGSPPHKNYSYTDISHRLNMLKLAITDNSNFEVSEIEINKSTPGYTVDMLQELKKIIQKDIYFIIGADSLINIKTWHQYEKLLSLANFVVFPRVLANFNETNLASNIKYLKDWIINNLTVSLDKFFFIDFPVLEISSTIVRQKILEKRSINYLVPAKVIQYIYEENLY